METKPKIFEPAERYSLPNPPHGVKVKAQVMQRVKGASGHFACPVKVTQIGARKGAAGVAGARRIERSVVFGKPRVFDVQRPFLVKSWPFRASRRHHATHMSTPRATQSPRSIGSRHTVNSVAYRGIRGVVFYYLVHRLLAPDSEPRSQPHTHKTVVPLIRPRSGKVRAPEMPTVFMFLSPIVKAGLFPFEERCAALAHLAVARAKDRSPRGRRRAGMRRAHRGRNRGE